MVKTKKHAAGCVVLMAAKVLKAFGGLVYEESTDELCSGLLSRSRRRSHFRCASSDAARHCTLNPKPETLHEESCRPAQVQSASHLSYSLNSGKGFIEGII